MITKVELENLKNFLESITSRPNMLISHTEGNNLRIYSKKYLNRNVTSNCGSCLRRELYLLIDFVNRELNNLNDEVEIVEEELTKKVRKSNKWKQELEKEEEEGE